MKFTLCQNCGKERNLFKSDKSFYNHACRPKHETFCDQCNSSFSSSITLKRHVESIHKGIEYTCEKCEKSFTNYSNLLRHVKNHEQIKDYTCEECKKSFSRKEHLKKHLFSCIKNEKKSKKEKQNKVVNESEKDFYMCDVCDRSFTRKDALKRHIGIHSESSNVFQCNDCMKTFSRSDTLTSHLETHTSIQHQCEDCGESFTKLKNLKRHKENKHKIIIPGLGLIYSKEKVQTQANFKCKFCQNTYTTKYGAETHETKYHSNALNSNIVNFGKNQFATFFTPGIKLKNLGLSITLKGVL